MTEAEERAAVVAEARTWLRTPWHHHARVKGAGVDCAMLPAAVFEATGHIPHIDPNYPRQWAQHRDEERFVEWILQFAREISREDVKPGDLGVWHYGRTYSHGAIFTSYDTVVHAMIGMGVIEETVDGNEELRTRAARYFTIWGR